MATALPRALQGRTPGYRHEGVEGPTRLAHLREALGRLRSVVDVRELGERAVRELCETVGFDRAVLFTIESDELVAEHAWFSGDADWAKEFVALARRPEVRPRLDHMLLESEVVRRRRPLLVLDPENDPRTYKPLVRATQTQSYVAAPVMPGGHVIAMLHVDRYMTGQTMTDDDVDVLWTFAEGFGYAYERMRLLSRLRRHAAELAQVGGMPVMAPPALKSVGPAPDARPVLDAADSPLTAREHEVIQLVSSGATNQEIANSLVISESTVKSHVKHILRKLGASNRAEAVSRHLTTAEED
ncbi:MAG: LuxR family transcriptional regulator, regulator of acetate metabolism [Thermoleophilaceae bacterium]|nr:LuxR family transcriptional regulator, regulator of acetate metabolism [Thermoleophilaceae bacterium]